MKADNEKLLEAAKSRSKEIKKYFERLRHKKPRELDEIVSALHEEVFAEIDCLDCANCCRILGPKFTPRDIVKASAALGLREASFKKAYLREDEDGDLVFQSPSLSLRPGGQPLLDLRRAAEGLQRVSPYGRAVPLPAPRGGKERLPLPGPVRPVRKAQAEASSMIRKEVLPGLLLALGLLFRLSVGASAETPRPLAESGREYLGVVEKLKPLAKPEVIANGDRTVKKVALTLDDGWVEDEALLALLKKYRIRCTVFIPGRVAALRPQWIKKLDKEGFEVANHSYSHRTLTALSDEELSKDVLAGQALITKLTGKTYPYFRPPAGAVNDRVLRVLADLGYKVILWDNDVLGYLKGGTASSQLANLRTYKKNGNIILAHFGSALRTAEVLKTFIPEMLAEGYEFVTVTELLKGAAPGKEKPQPKEEVPRSLLD